MPRSRDEMNDSGLGEKARTVVQCTPVLSARCMLESKQEEVCRNGAIRNQPDIKPDIVGRRAHEGV